jgi:hypothetical protein
VGNVCSPAFACSDCSLFEFRLLVLLEKRN